MIPLSLSFLGAFHVAAAQEQLTDFESDKARALLAYLAVEQTRPHERSKLAALFWPEQNHRAALRNLTQTLSRVRRALRDRKAASSYILSSNQTIQFNPTCPHRLDVAEFMLGMAANLPAQMESAVALYQGEFLTGFDLPDCPEFESWLLFRREHYQRHVMDALQRLAEVALVSGDYAKAIGFGRRQLEIDNLHEMAYRQLMLALARAGHRHKALAQYQQCFDRLQTELGVSPEQETVDLFIQIRDDALPPTDDFPTQNGMPVADAPPEPISNLPAITTPLLGRDAEMAWLIQRFTAAGERFVTVIGPGGGGKTHLALHTAHALQPHFADGVYFVSLVAATSREQVIGTIANALRLTFQSTQLTQSRLLDYLRERHLLLILDNFEHLADAVMVVDAILQHAPHVAMLATSRERLNLHGEQLYVLGGLGVPAPDAPYAEIGDSGAIQLFVQSAKRTTDAFALDDDNGLHVAKIVRLLEGLPLAIELAAAWIRILDCQTIAEEIEKSLDFLTSPYRNFPERHRSLRTVFDYSWQLASPLEQQAMRRLAVFAGSFTHRAAEEIGGANLAVLLSLLDKSLLQNDSSLRLRWHPLIHQYALEHLTAEPVEEAMVWQRYARYYFELLDKRSRQIRGSLQKQILLEIDEELDNIMAVLRHIGTVAADVPEDGMALVTLSQFFRIRGRLEELIESAEEIVHHLEAQGNGEHNGLYWQLRLFLGCALVHVSHYDKAEIHLQAVLPHLDPEKQAYLRALCLQHQGTLFVHYGRFDQATVQYQQALNIFQALGDENAQADSFNSLGVASNDLGKYVDAVQHLDQSIELNRRVGNSAALAFALSNRGATAQNTHVYEEARRYHAEALTVAREVDFRPGVMLCLLNLADVAISLGELETACALGQEGLALTQENHEPRQAVWARTSLGRAELGRGNVAVAYEHFCRGIATGVAINVTPRVLEAMVGLVQWQVQEEEVEAAAELLGFCLHQPNLQRKIRERATVYFDMITQMLSETTHVAASTRGRSKALHQIAEEILLAYNKTHDQSIEIATETAW